MLAYGACSVQSQADRAASKGEPSSAAHVHCDGGSGRTLMTPEAAVRIQSATARANEGMVPKGSFAARAQVGCMIRPLPTSGTYSTYSQDAGNAGGDCTGVAHCHKQGSTHQD
jgi:hypothetical protein